MPTLSFAGILAPTEQRARRVPRARLDAGPAEAEAVIVTLVVLFAGAADVVGEAGGMMVAFSGNGFIAAFNAALPVDDPEARAAAAALAVRGWTRARRHAGRRLALRAGIAMGALAAGRVGRAGRRTGTVSGDAMNLAVRLQEMAEAEGLETLICGDTPAAVEGARPVRAAAPCHGRVRPAAVRALVPAAAASPSSRSPPRRPRDAAPR